MRLTWPSARYKKLLGHNEKYSYWIAPGYEWQITYFFRWQRKTARLSDGKQFHRAGPDTVNALAPTVERRTGGMRRWLQCCIKCISNTLHQILSGRQQNTKYFSNVFFKYKIPFRHFDFTDNIDNSLQASLLLYSLTPDGNLSRM